jgi:hypothetical protein
LAGKLQLAKPPPADVIFIVFSLGDFSLSAWAVRERASVTIPLSFACSLSLCVRWEHLNKIFMPKSILRAHTQSAARSGTAKLKYKHKLDGKTATERVCVCEREFLSEMEELRNQEKSGVRSAVGGNA